MFALLPQKRAFVDHLRALNTNSETNIRLFVDLRNAITIFHDEAQAQMQLKDTTFMITEIVKDILGFIDYMYEIVPFKLEFNFFWEVGRSEYHKKINKNYKSKRGNSYLILSPDDVTKLKDINIIAFLIWEEVAKHIHNVRCYKLNYFEADFIPHYIINKLDLSNENKFKLDNTYNYIFSTDKDLGQTINNPKTFQVKKIWDQVPEYNVEGKYIGTKRGRATKIVDYLTVNNEILKDYELKFPPASNYIVTLLALVGDDADEIVGLRGISYKKAVEMLELMEWKKVSEFMEHWESYDSFYEHVKNKMPENLEIKLYNDEQERLGKARRKKFKEPFGVTFERAFKIILDDRIPIEDNLKQIDFDIIQKNIPFKTEQDIIEIYSNESTLDLFKLNKELKTLNINVQDFKYGCSDIVNREYGIHLLGEVNFGENTYWNNDVKLDNIWADLPKSNYNETKSPESSSNSGKGLYNYDEDILF